MNRFAVVLVALVAVAGLAEAAQAKPQSFAR
jgi:hypothetical protein